MGTAVGRKQRQKLKTELDGEIWPISQQSQFISHSVECNISVT